MRNDGKISPRGGSSSDAKIDNISSTLSTCVIYWKVIDQYTQVAKFVYTEKDEATDLRHVPHENYLPTYQLSLRVVEFFHFDVRGGRVGRIE